MVNERIGVNDHIAKVNCAFGVTYAGNESHHQECWPDYAAA